MKGVLLDTHALIWLLEGMAPLGAEARSLADAAVRGDALFISAMSFWEIAMLAQRRRLMLDQPVGSWRRKVLDLGILEVPVSGDIGILATELGDYPQDPADRLIGATAMLRGATLLTADGAILSWQGLLDRKDARG